MLENTKIENVIKSTSDSLNNLKQQQEERNLKIILAINSLKESNADLLSKNVFLSSQNIELENNLQDFRNKYNLLFDNYKFLHEKFIDLVKKIDEFKTEQFSIEDRIQNALISAQVGFQLNKDFDLTNKKMEDVLEKIQS